MLTSSYSSATRLPVASCVYVLRPGGRPAGVVTGHRLVLPWEAKRGESRSATSRVYPRPDHGSVVLAAAYGTWHARSAGEMSDDWT